MVIGSLLKVWKVETHPNPMFSQAHAQRVGCHYDHARVKDATSLPFFFSAKQKKYYIYTNIFIKINK